MFDVVIIGAGPAGLSAALVLGRCRRQVVVCDRGTPRNAASRALHGFLTRDGIAPADLLRAGRDEVRGYGIDIRDVGVDDVQSRESGFVVQLESGEELRSRIVLMVQFAIVAAAEGAKAAVAINTALQQRSREAAAAARLG